MSSLPSVAPLRSRSEPTHGSLRSRLPAVGLPLTVRSIRGSLTPRSVRSSLRSPAERRSVEPSLASLARTPWSIAPRALLRRLRRTPLTHGGLPPVGLRLPVRYLRGLTGSATLRLAPLGCLAHGSLCFPFGYSAAACAAALLAGHFVPRSLSPRRLAPPRVPPRRSCRPAAAPRRRIRRP